jgi:hypothetical protein
MGTAHPLVCVTRSNRGCYGYLLSQLLGATFPSYELPLETLKSHCGDGDKALLTEKLMWDYADKGFLRVRVESASERSPDALLVTSAQYVRSVVGSAFPRRFTQIPARAPSVVISLCYVD